MKKISNIPMCIATSLDEWVLYTWHSRSKGFKSWQGQYFPPYLEYGVHKHNENGLFSYVFILQFHLFTYFDFKCEFFRFIV